MCVSAPQEEVLSQGQSNSKTIKVPYTEEPVGTELTTDEQTVCLSVCLSEKVLLTE